MPTTHFKVIALDGGDFFVGVDYTAALHAGDRTWRETPDGPMVQPRAYADPRRAMTDLMGRFRGDELLDLPRRYRLFEVEVTRADRDDPAPEHWVSVRTIRFLDELDPLLGLGPQARHSLALIEHMRALSSDDWLRLYRAAKSRAAEEWRSLIKKYGTYTAAAQARDRASYHGSAITERAMAHRRADQTANRAGYGAVWTIAASMAHTVAGSTIDTFVYSRAAGGDYWMLRDCYVEAAEAVAVRHLLPEADFAALTDTWQQAIGRVPSDE